MVSEQLKFPLGNPHSKDSYLDWMRDLSWLGKEAYMFIIVNYNKFMDEDNKEKEEVMDMFETCILPFWEREVVDCVDEGYPKVFNVYLIE